MNAIKIAWNGRSYNSLIIKDYKVKINIEEYPFSIELDQCKECGKWCSEDEGLYGDGYCDYCATMCFHCELYFNHHDMLRVSDSEMVCTECGEKHHPNLLKYNKAIDDVSDIRVEKGDVRVILEYIGEGEKPGGYTGSEDDIPYMRFCISQKEYVEDGVDHPDWNWVEVDDGSCLTRIPVLTPALTLVELAGIILDKVFDYVVDEEECVRDIAQELSRINGSEIV